MRPSRYCFYQLIRREAAAATPNKLNFPLSSAQIILILKFCVLFNQQNYQRDGFPLTDLQKFLKEQKDFPILEESRQTDADVRQSVFCCCQRYDSVHNNVDTVTIFNLSSHTLIRTHTHAHREAALYKHDYYHRKQQEHCHYMPCSRAVFSQQVLFTSFQPSPIGFCCVG